MKYLVMLYNYILRETWWRKYYKRVDISHVDIFENRCDMCDAGTPSQTPRCDFMKDRDCPCKWHQCLKLKKKLIK